MPCIGIKSSFMKNFLSTEDNYVAVLLSTVFAFTEGATCLVYAADDNAVTVKEANYIINKFQMAEDIAYQKLKEGSPESAVNFPQSLTVEVLIEHETASGDLEYFYLEDKDTDDKTVTCVTDKLCEVILTYKDADVQNVKEPESVSDSKTEVKEDDETIVNPEKPELSEILNQKQNFIVLWILLAILVFTGIMMLIIRYRHNKNQHN